MLKHVSNLYRLINYISLILVFAAAPGALSAQNILIEEIIVTAQKREESLQDVPISITAFTGETVESLGLINSADIAAQTPNLTWRSEFGYTTPQVFLRGVGNNTYHASGVAPVGIYIDGVSLGSNITHGIQLYDLERIEVLKGPQGTLYGRNTTGGLVNFIANKPDPTTGTNGSLRATYGRFNQLDIEGALGFAFSDTVAARIAIFSNNRDGIFDNNAPNSSFDEGGNTDALAGRAQLRFMPNDRLDVLLAGYFGDNDSDLRPAKNKGSVAPGGLTFALTPCPVHLVSLGGPCQNDNGFVDSDDYHESFDNIKSREELETYGGHATIKYQFDSFTVTSVTGYVTAERFMLEETDHSPFDRLNGSYTTDFDQFSQEIRLNSTGGGRFHWIAGFYYYEDDLNQIENYNVNDAPLKTLLFLVNADPRFLFVGPPEEGLGTQLLQDTTSYAVFGELSFDLLDRISITGGLRWTSDKRDVNSYETFIYDATDYRGAFTTLEQARSAFYAQAVPPLSLEDTWEELSGRAVLDYQVNENIFAYASYSRGFKGGEFNPAFFGADSVTIADPEFINSIELGVKTAFLDDRLRINISAFDYSFKSQQVFVFTTDNPFFSDQSLTNAGQSTIQGIEVDVAFSPAESLFTQFGLGILDATYDRFTNPNAANPALRDFSGNTIPSSPDISFNGLVRYEHRMAHGGTLTLQTDFSYYDDQFFTPPNDPFIFQEGYWLLNGRIAYRPPNEDFELAFWAKNITNKDYFTAIFDLAPFGFYPGFTGDPITWGVTFSYDYHH